MSFNTEFTFVGGNVVNTGVGADADGIGSVIDFRTLPACVPSLCIPRVYPNINEDRIRKIFDDLELGIIERVDIVGKTTEKGDKYNRVFIHFKTWFAGGNAEVARVRLLSGKDIKVIYDEPWFWKISAYREREINQRPVKRPSAEKKATIVIDSGKIAPGLSITDSCKIAPGLSITDSCKIAPGLSINDDNRNRKQENFKKVKKEDFHNEANQKKETNNRKKDTNNRKKERELIKYSGVYGPNIEMNGGICMDLPKKKQTKNEKV
jgi:hypothetical protein